MDKVDNLQKNLSKFAECNFGKNVKINVHYVLNNLYLTIMMKFIEDLDFNYIQDLVLSSKILKHAYHKFGILRENVHISQ